MKNFIRKRLRENLRIPSEYNKVLSDSDKEQIKNIPYNEIELNQVGDDGNNIINISIGLKDINIDDSIVLDIQKLTFCHRKKCCTLILQYLR